MSIGKAGKSRSVRVSRYDREICRICKSPVLHGQAYCYTGGTNTNNQYVVHYNCMKPTSAPTWEELQARHDKTG